MKATGIIRRVDDLGRIVIPKDIRRQLGIQEMTPMELFVTDDDGVLFKIYRPEQPILSIVEQLRVAVEDAEDFSCKSEVLRSVYEIKEKLKQEAQKSKGTENHDRKSKPVPPGQSCRPDRRSNS